MKKLLFLFLLVIPILGCTKIDYIGEEYPPTDYVDIYFDEADVQHDFKIMGKLIATADDIVSAEKMLKKIREKAMAKGADGVIVTGFDRFRTSETTKFEETTKEEKDKTVTTAVSSTEVNEKNKGFSKTYFINCWPGPVLFLFLSA